MKINKTFAAGLILVLGFIASGTALTKTTPVKQAPDFTLRSLEGENVKLSELRGNVVMINFWASWCGPCRQEMPLLESLYQRYNALGFELLGVNVEQDVDDAKRWLADRPVSFPVLLDPENELTKIYQVKAMPSTILVDRDGNVRHLHKGYKPGDEDTYQQLVRSLIRE
jgi:peroxiredoxin